MDFGGDCWIWHGVIDDKGYGRFNVKEAGVWRIRLAHRIAWCLTRGGIPEGMEVCHQCDTPLCTRPAHLFLGTHSDNMRDMATKGRARAGTYVMDSERQARVMALRKEGWSFERIGRELGVHGETARRHYHQGKACGV